MNPVRIFFQFSHLICLILMFFGVDSPAASESRIEKRLNEIIGASRLSRANLGLAVVDLGHQPQTQSFGLNEKAAMIPASVTKLTTASAALRRLGPSFKFQTTLSSSASIREGVLQGDLVLKGGGDPGFVSETLWFLVNELTRTGLKKIQGDIVVDDSDFDTIRADASRDPERVDRAYDAPVGAMSLNWNSINVFIRPGPNVGSAALVVLDPLGDYFQIDNKAKTTAGAGNNLEVSRVEDRLVVRGHLGIQHDEVAVYKNIDDPIDWSGRNLVAFLNQRGISVAGKVKAGRRPSGAKLLAKADSKPVAQAVADMLKFSNNYVAEMLTKDLALQNGTAPATLEAGMRVIRQHMTEDLGLDGARFQLFNPSGLSRQNRLTARDLAEVLVQAQRHFPTFAELLTALPLAGLDGTLKKRMTGSTTSGWVRAKTGNLSGVVALAGYAGRKDGQLSAFAFIFNGKAELADSVRHLFDAMAAELVQ